MKHNEFVTMKKLLTIFLLHVVGVLTVVAQPSNDDCANPILISDVTAFCSASGAFSNNGASPSAYSAPLCFGPSVFSDVWFSFVAEATDVNITVRGATTPSSGGTLNDPQIVLYGGNCGGTLDQLECQSSAGNSNVVEAYQGGLFVGSTYYIRIQGANGQTGTFQICINNYNPPVDPQSDCPEAAILCDKSPFVVQNVSGAGSDISELNGAECFFNGQGTNFETNSTWFVWTCATPGMLTFALTPNNGPDDLDFVLYRLPNGIGNCQNKLIERCMASGQSSNINSAACLGATGLRDGETDISEDAGCSDPGDNAWLAPLNMEAGVTYALCVNNFSTYGNGFSVEFGGTGTFLGPEAKFQTIPNAVCIGVPVQIVDQSSFSLGAITDYQWSFGANSEPPTASGKGPHEVVFNTAGIRSVVLTLTTELGCKVTDIQTLTVYPDVTVDTIIAVPDCNGGTNGAVEISNITSGTPPYLFSWNSGPFTSDNSLTGLGEGTYNLLIRDANNCETELDIDVLELRLEVDPTVTPPLCTGDANGLIALEVTNGTGPYQFDWGNGFSSNSSQAGLTAGVYTILGLDSKLCKGTFSVTVTDHPPVSILVDTIDITCFNANNGAGVATGLGGVGGFSYQWSDGQNQSEAERLSPGTYQVTATDANGCTAVAAIKVNEPPELDVQLIDQKDLLCFGLPTGIIELGATGGTPGYEYSADGGQYVDSPVLLNLYAGDYWAKVRDALGCLDSVFVRLQQPPELVVLAQPGDTLVELGYPVQVSTVVGPAGRLVTYQWTPDVGLSCTTCSEPTVQAISDEDYVVKITDQDGCMDTAVVRVRINQLRPVYFPNVFDPEKGVFPNDFFTGFAGPAAIEIRLLRVYDRWGGHVFEASNIPLNEPSLGWNGKIGGRDGAVGVYTWYALVRFVDGVELEYKGSTTLVR